MTDYQYLAHTYFTDEELKNIYTFYVLNENGLEHYPNIDKEEKEKILKAVKKLAKFLDDSRRDEDDIFELTLKNCLPESPEMKQIQRI